MRKGYVRRWKLREGPDGIDYWFTSNPKLAACWETKAKADADCGLLDLHRIVISSSEGGAYVCRDFKSEELGPDKFAIFCTAPFVP
jgi:hypothetical protein